MRTSKVQRRYQLISRIEAMGFTYDEAQQLRRIEMTLQRWAELECGNGNDHSSWGIERDETTGKPFMHIHPHQGKSRKYAVADRERGALRRLEVLMLGHPEYLAYHQTDPRGCALYIIPKSILNATERLDCVYNRGLAVCD